MDHFQIAYRIPTLGTFMLLWLTLNVLVGEARCADAAAAAGQENPAESVSFRDDVAPVLIERCLACHGPDRAESNYRVDTYEHLLQPGDYQTAPIVPGDVEDSLLYYLISSDDEDERMPLGADPLTPHEIELLKAWVEQGAEPGGVNPAELLTAARARLPYPSAPEMYPAPLPITATAFQPQDRSLIIGGYHELLVWNTDGKLARRMGNMPQRTMGLALHPDGRRLAIVGGEPGRSGDVRVIDVSSGAVKFAHRLSKVAYGVAFRPDGAKLAAACGDGTLRLYDAESGAMERIIENHADWVNAVTWSPDGQRIATASRDQSAKVFEAATGSLITTYSGHGGSVRGIAFHSDGKRIYSAGADRRIHEWSAEDGANKGHFDGFASGVERLLIAGGHLFSCADNTKVRQYKLDDRTLVRELPDHPDWVSSIVVNESADRLAAGTMNGQVVVWNLSDGGKFAAFSALPGYEAK